MYGRFYLTTNLIAVSIIHCIALLPVNTTEQSFTSECSIVHNILYKHYYYCYYFISLISTA